MKDKVVILGTAHRRREPGKQSPDGRLKEFFWSREIVSDLKLKLEDYEVRTFVDFEDFDLPKNMQTPSSRLERQRELGLRVNAVNQICDRYGKDNCLYVSIHVNAMGNGDNWNNARGWQVCVSPDASKSSRVLAESLAEQARQFSLRVRQPSPDRRYWEQSLYVLNRTKCPAVLTENLFMDNRDDVDYLLSDEGRHVIERTHLEGILNYIL